MSIDVISVLGGGWSAATYDKSKLPGLIIGVNDSAVRAPCEIAVSMDRLWTEHRWRWLQERLTQVRPLRDAHIRRSALSNIADRPPWLHVFENDHMSVDLTDEPGRLNGTNSGVCAINLAFQMRPRRVILFGFDMTRSPKGQAYWFPPYEWARPEGATSAGKYRAWASEFATIARQFEAEGIEVLNASLVSAISAFPKVDPRSLLRA